MSEKRKEYVRQSLDKLRANLTKEERLKILASLSAEEIIQGLPPETLEALARQLKANGHSAKPQ